MSDGGSEPRPEDEEPFEDDEGSEFDSEESDPMAQLDPDNPLLARVQQSLKAQIEKELARLREEIREKEEGLRKTKRAREEMGSQLYAAQQQLAKLQMQADTAQDTAMSLAELRVAAEEALSKARSTYETEQGKVKTMQANHKEVQLKLDTINATLGQVDIYNDELKAQIAVTRRATYKAEESMTVLEKEKKRQDVEIDQLNERVKRLEEEKATLEVQLVSQREETRNAAETLREAATEMEAIRYEKNQLLSQWKTSLVHVSRRDEALRALEDSRRELQERAMTIDAEISGVKKATTREHEENEKLTAVVNKVETEAKYLESEMNKIAAEKERLKEQYALLQGTLSKTDAEMATVMQERQGLLEEMKGLQRTGDVLLNEARKFDEEAQALLTDQITLKKGAVITKKDAAKIKGNVHEQEISHASYENELARIKVDMLNTQSHNQQLNDALSAILRELKEQEELVDKYELEIRRRNDRIEKKQSEVDRLNKKYDQLKSNQLDENTGPLEATIHNLLKAIAGVEQECTDLQNYWLRSQKSLVKNEKAASEQAEQIGQLRSQLAVLQQRNLRLNASAEAHVNEAAEYRSIIRNQHTSLQQLNTLITKNTQRQTELADSNLTLENDFLEKLAKAEEEAKKLENSIVDIDEEKTFLLGDIIEAEKQVMLWEKKIQLAKETQTALDPEVGAAEVRQMKKEIHRMTLRHQALERKQEQMVQEMEKALVRREHIGAKGRLQSKKASTSQATVKKDVIALNKKIKQTVAECTQVDQEIAACKEAQGDLSQRLDETHGLVQRLREEEKDLRGGVEEDSWRRQHNFESVTRFQRFVKRYQEVERGTYGALTTPDTITAEYEKHQGRREALVSIIESLQKDEGRHADRNRALQRLALSARW